jgi:AraC-like DNA-binding protein
MTHSASSEWIRSLLEVARERGLDSAAWLQSLGYDPDCLSADRVPFSIEEQLFLEMQQRDPSFGMSAVQALRPGSLARVSYSMQASATLRAGLAKVIAVSRLFNDAYRFVETSGDKTLEIAMVRIAPGDVIVESSSQFTLARMMFFARNVLRSAPRELSPVEVNFRNRPSPNADELRRFFGDCVRFSQPRNSIVFRDADLDLPLPTSDPNLAKILDDAIARQLTSLRQETVIERLYNEIAVDLSFGVPQAGDVAARLGLSTRTMNRQLADAGTSFTDMLQEIRFARAQAWLDAGESATAVAALTFYSEVAAFFRAYRRHFGRSPGPSSAPASEA